MGVIYLLTLAWLLLFAGLVVVTVFYTLAWLQCDNLPSSECIDYNQFSEYPLHPSLKTLFWEP